MSQYVTKIKNGAGGNEPSSSLHTSLLLFAQAMHRSPVANSAEYGISEGGISLSPICPVDECTTEAEEAAFHAQRFLAGVTALGRRSHEVYSALEAADQSKQKRTRQNVSSPPRSMPTPSKSAALRLSAKKMGPPSRLPVDSSAVSMAASKENKPSNNGVSRLGGLKKPMGTSKLFSISSLVSQNMNPTVTSNIPKPAAAELPTSPLRTIEPARATKTLVLDSPPKPEILPPRTPRRAMSVDITNGIKAATTPLTKQHSFTPRASPLLSELEKSLSETAAAWKEVDTVIVQRRRRSTLFICTPFLDEDGELLKAQTPAPIEEESDVKAIKLESEFAPAVEPLIEVEVSHNANQHLFSAVDEETEIADPIVSDESISEIQPSVSEELEPESIVPNIEMSFQPASIQIPEPVCESVTVPVSEPVVILEPRTPRHVKTAAPTTTTARRTRSTAKKEAQILHEQELQDQSNSSQQAVLESEPVETESAIDQLMKKQANRRKMLEAPPPTQKAKVFHSPVGSKPVYSEVLPEDAAFVCTKKSLRRQVKMEAY